LLFFAILAIFGLLGHLPGTALLWLPAPMVVNIAFALGFGLALGVLNVFVRDVGQIVPVIMQFLFWLTPIVYMADIIPSKYRGWLLLNPLIPIITGYQNALLFNRPPNWLALTVVALIAATLLAFALVLFRRASPEMVDQL
jgi:lipopolysaccharide transport system permease protein